MRKEEIQPARILETNEKMIHSYRYVQSYRLYIAKWHVKRGIPLIEYGASVSSVVGICRLPVNAEREIPKTKIQST